MTKPHIRRWVCCGLDLGWLCLDEFGAYAGDTPQEAYQDWLISHV